MPTHTPPTGDASAAGAVLEPTTPSITSASSLRLICAIAGSEGFVAHQWPVVFAQLGPLPSDEPVELYRAPPPADQTLFRLVKPMLGSPSSTTLWLRLITSHLLHLGYTPLTLDPGVFHMTTDALGSPQTVLVSLHVDCVCAIASHSDDESLLDLLATSLSAVDYVSDMSPVHTLLGIDFDDSSGDAIVLRQRSYISSLVARHRCALSSFSSRPPLTPADENASTGLAAHVAAALATTAANETYLTLFQSIVTSLTRCADGARPDVAYATGMLARCFHCPTPSLLGDAYRVLRYLETDLDTGITYSRAQSPLAGMSDSDWSTGRSTTGWAFLYANASILWGTIAQPSIALSTCEAELMALSSAGDAAVLLGKRLQAVGRRSPSPIPLSVDNKAARDLAYNPEHHDKSKHIMAHHFRIRLNVESHRIIVPFVSTDDNYSDFFTKALRTPVFMKFRRTIMNISTP